MIQRLWRRVDLMRLWRPVNLMRLWRMVGWLGILATLVLSLMPPALGNDTAHLDKLAHLSGYALLMFWWAQLVIQQRWKLALAVVAFGVGIELLQGLTPDRMPDALDALSNATGVLLGWLAARLSPNLLARLAALPDWQR